MYANIKRQLLWFGLTKLNYYCFKTQNYVSSRYIRVYIAYKANKIYLLDPGGPPSALSAAVSPSASSPRRLPHSSTSSERSKVLASVLSSPSR